MFELHCSVSELGCSDMRLTADQPSSIQRPKYTCFNALMPWQCVSCAPPASQGGNSTARKAGQIIARGDSRWLIRVYLGRYPETKKRNYYNRTHDLGGITYIHGREVPLKNVISPPGKHMRLSRVGPRSPIELSTGRRF